MKLKIFPTVKQFRNWKFPTKLGTIGAYVTILALMIALPFEFINLAEKQEYTKNLELLIEKVSDVPEKIELEKSLNIPDSVMNNITALEIYLEENEDKQKVLKDYFNNLAAAYNKIVVAHFYTNLPDYPKLIKYCNKAIELNPKYPALFKNRGNIFVKLKEFEQALNDYNHAIEMDPYYAEAYSNRGAIYFLAGKYDLAIKDLKKAVELKNDLYHAFNTLGAIYYELGDYKQAGNYFDITLKIKKDYPDAYHNRGLMYDEIGDYSLAIKDYNHAIELNPAYLEAYINRGSTYMKIGKYQRAIEDFNKSLELYPGYTLSYYNLGCVYSLAKNLPMTLKYLKKCFDSGFDEFDWIQEDSEWDNYRENQDFKKLIAHYRNLN